MQRLDSEQKEIPLPESFRPLLWWMRWEDVDPTEDREDIIVSTINNGTLAQWRWLINTYGEKAIRTVLQKRLASEFHTESRNLAKIVFSIPAFRHARTSTHT